MHKFVWSEDILTTVKPNTDAAFIISSGAWGDRFLNHFFDNIQRNHDLCRSKVTEPFEYVFYTTSEDYDKYKDRFTAKDMTFIFMGNKPHPGGMNGAQFDYASRRNLPVILMAADCLHTPNLIPNLRSKFQDKNAVCVMSQRMFPELMADIKNKELEIPYEDIFQPREFLKLCLPRLHRRERRYFMDSYRCTGTYGALMFPVRCGGVLTGILVRSFHLGYIYVKNPVAGMVGGFLDSNPFVSKLTTPDTVGMVTDSDDGFCVDVSLDVNDNGNDPLPILTDLSQITRCRVGWLGHAVFPVNDSLMGYNIAVHSEPINQEWTELADKANAFVTSIYNNAVNNKPLDWRMQP